jgi:predicted RNA-binding protein with PIN domain
MAILIDGYNLLHAAGLGRARYGPGGLEKARRALLGALAASLGTEREHTTVVFDAAGAPPGAARQYEYQGVAVRFASSHADADALLEELIEADSAPRRLRVVSSDRRIQRAARRRRGHAVDSEAFLAELQRRRMKERSARARLPEEPLAKRKGNLSPSELAFWLEEFGVADEPDQTAEHGMPDAVPLKGASPKAARPRKPR